MTGNITPWWAHHIDQILSSKADFQAYKDLNNELPDPFTTTGKKPQIHGPEFHPNRGSVTSQQEHVHIGPVNHIPITD